MTLFNGLNVLHFVHHLALLNFTPLTGQFSNKYSSLIIVFTCEVIWSCYWLSMCKIFDLMLKTTGAKREMKPLKAVFYCYLLGICVYRLYLVIKMFLKFLEISEVRF